MFFKKLLLSLLLCLAVTACKSSEERAQAAFESGMALLEAGDEARAKVEFRNALKLVKTHLEARLQLARLNLATGDTSAAFRNYLRIVEQYPDHLEAHRTLSELAFMNESWETFERHSTEAIRLAPEDPAVKIIDVAGRYRTAVIEEDAPTRSSVITEAKALKESTPDSAILRQILIDGYLAEQKYEKALALIDEAIAAAPDNPAFYRLKIQVLVSLGDESGVEQSLRTMAAAFPEDLNVQGGLLQLLISRGRTDEAEAFLRERVAGASEGDNTSFITLIQFLVRTGKIDAALEELEQEISQDPGAYTLRALRASLYYDRGERDKAIADMQSIVENEADALSAEETQNIKITLATMLATNGNEVGARRLVEEILDQDPNVANALKMQARWMINDDNTDGAITAMRTALAESPQDHEAMTIMAEAYQRAGNSDLMLNFLSLAVEAANNAPPQALRYASALVALEKLAAAESTLITALRLAPGNVDILTALGSIYIQQDDVPRLRQVANTLKRSEETAARNAATALEIELLARESDTREVLEYLETLENEGNSSDGVKLAVIRAKLQNGDIEEALEYVNELVADSPDNLSYAYFRGLTLATTRDYEAAEKVFLDIVEKKPDAEVVWSQLARLQSVIRSPEQTMATLDKALEALPESDNLLWAKASALQEKGDIDGAIGIYEDIYARNSASVVIANNLASLLATYRTNEESLARARLIARRLKGTDVPAFQDTYGWILFRNGNPEEALTYLEPAAQNLPGDASVQFHLGVVYEALGRREEALAQMRRAMETIGPFGTIALTDEIRSKITALEAPPEN